MRKPHFSLASMVVLVMATSSLSAQKLPENKTGSSPDASASATAEAERAAAESMVTPILSDGYELPMTPLIHPDEPEPVPIKLFDLPNVSALPGGSRLRDRGPTFRVKAFEFIGNTVFTSNQLGELLQDYLKRPVDSEDLESARDKLTQYYINQGYVTSGALLPDQYLAGGKIRFQIVEGTLSRIELLGNHWLRDAYLRPRMRMNPKIPLNMNRMRDHLQLLQQNPMIKKLSAEIEPDAKPGVSYLKATVDEQFPISAGFTANNHRPPSVGSEQLEFWLVDGSLLGFCDRLELRYGLFQHGFDNNGVGGLDNYLIDYRIPFTPWDTTFNFSLLSSSDVVIEEPFTELNIEGKAQTLHFAIQQPLLRTNKNEVSFRFSVDLRKSVSRVAGEPFTITPGAVNGEIKLSVLRFEQEWTNRSANHVLALRSTFSLGIDFDGSTDDGGERTGKFFAWLGEGQYVRRLFDTDIQLLIRGTLQLTSDPLLAPEQLSVGGAATVRGYRENQLVRDNAWVSSLELRFPIWKYRKETTLSLVPFVDVGGGWNVVRDGEDDAQETIASAGIGLELAVARHFDLQIYWGHGFKTFDYSGHNLQDDGFHINLNATLF